jgi:hypothetical protein
MRTGKHASLISEALSPRQSRLIPLERLRLKRLRLGLRPGDQSGRDRRYQQDCAPFAPRNTVASAATARELLFF